MAGTFSLSEPTIDPPPPASSDQYRPQGMRSEQACSVDMPFDTQTRDPINSDPKQLRSERKRSLDKAFAGRAGGGGGHEGSGVPVQPEVPHSPASCLADRCMLRVTGGGPLRGEVAISGAKNAALPILYAAILTPRPVHLSNVPRIVDVLTTIHILEALGARVDLTGATSLRVDGRAIGRYCVPAHLGKRLRASIWALGPLVARFGEGKVAFPGGCPLGARPVDLHIAGLRQLGAHVAVTDNAIQATCAGRLKGARVVLDLVSVGATITIMCAAVLAEGTTTVDNAAREPEVADTAAFLNRLGARVSGAGTGRLVIEGVRELRGGAHSVIPDRIETGTYLMAAAVSGGCVACRGTSAALLGSVLATFREAGALITTTEDSITLDMAGRRLRAVDLTTAPYPGFPTDLQPLFVLLNAVANGAGAITDTIFKDRFQVVPELQKMGADAVFDGAATVRVTGGTLSAACVSARDLRGAASLVIAACVATGVTTVTGLEHLHRGYGNFFECLSALGAQFAWVTHLETLGPPAAKCRGLPLQALLGKAEQCNGCAGRCRECGPGKWCDVRSGSVCGVTSMGRSPMDYCSLI